MTVALVKEPDVPASPFRVALAEWRQALSDVTALDATPYRAEDPDTHADELDQKAEQALERQRAAEWKLVRTPADGINDIRERALVVQDMFGRAALMGPPSDNVHRSMLDTLIAEILGSKAED
jgi:hypothetical protein